ncbi:hypothetical protein F2Q68_00021962 [Brassica cretica]|uniref:Uncharacterized protein n=1 Tax=Brassica cretica TaxID=69181 RepID=A0A8S9FQ05_BRACR|nr:hypothetical protein F2Q68_00021962 [Brassica cretica]
MKWVRYGLWETASKGRRECMDSCHIDVSEELGRYVATERNARSFATEWLGKLGKLGELGGIYGRKVCKLAGFLKTLEYWQRDKFWDLVSRFLILCLEMLETSALGLGQDLGLLLVLEGAMTNSTYVSRFSFILIPYRFKVRDSRKVIGVVVAQLFWLCMKAVLSFIAKDVVAKGLDHDAFVLSIREIKPKKLDTEPVRSQLRGDFLLGRDQAE